MLGAAARGSNALEHFDVIIVGAGISGIGAAYHLRRRCPDRSFAILERRRELGGTWDLFRYPGIRSDSDMHTLGYAFEPWTEPQAIAGAASIKAYLHKVVDDHGLGRHIRFDTSVVSADWSSSDARWKLRVVHGETESEYSCNFLMMCSGYYRYEKGYLPDFAGIDRFQGRVIHPQCWPDDIDYAGKNVVVIGSGATAVTIVPAMAESAAHVVMLQRSPSYIVSRPARDALALWLRRWLPEKLAYATARWKNILFGIYFFRLSRRKPATVKRRIVDMAREQLGGDFDVQTHFTPRYNPWDQRICLAPDGDFFAAIRSGRASVVTNEVDHLSATGISLKSGDHLPADIIVAATGLELQLMGGVNLTVDDQQIDLSKSFNYKGVMFSDIPNLASIFGYTNASWTLKAELASIYVCRLLTTMQQRGMRQATPRVGRPLSAAPFLDFSSGYVTRAMDRFPKQGDRKPWRLHQNYLLDLVTLRFGRLDDEMSLSNPIPPAQR